MGEHRYKAVVIDLFDTLVTWNPGGLPLMQFRGREIRSTTPLLYDTLETALGKNFDREKFSEAHASVYSDIFSERAKANALEITYVSIGAVREYKNHARVHDKKALAKAKALLMS